MNLYNIKIIAKYETKLLRRSWLFRIFGILTLIFGVGFLILTNSNLLDQFSMIWSRTALPSIIAFNATYLYSIVQAILVVFLAGGFLTRDKKLDTAEVIFVRPISNSDYIIGKSWGVMRLFLTLNLVLLVTAMFIQSVISHYPMDFYPFLFYFFTMSMISLLFMLGLSYIILLIVKSQPVMMILTLGYISLSFFYLDDFGFGIFDLFGVKQPALFSEIVGLPHPKLFLLQRSIYLLLGIGLICITIALFNRIPPHSWSKKRALLFGMLFIGAGVITGGYFYLEVSSNERQWATYRTTAIRYTDHPKVDIIEASIHYTSQGDQLQSSVLLTLRNPQAETMHDFLLYLNPKLHIDTIKIEGKQVDFKREHQVVIVKYPLQAKQSVELRMNYQGTIDERIAYIDLPLKERTAPDIERSNLNVGKRYVYLASDYTLLTPEIIWYPTSVPPSNPKAPYSTEQDYVRYTLQVSGSGHLKPISQGIRDSLAEGYRFTNINPLPSLTLSIGAYERMEITLDSVTYAVNYFQGHDFFSEHFVRIADTLPTLIKEQRESFERNCGRIYPYTKLELTEVPVHFTSYKRNWKGNSEYIAPEMILYPEYGVTLQVDFKTQKKRIQTWKRNEIPDERAIDAQTFVEIPIQLLTNEQRGNWFSTKPNLQYLNDMIFYFDGFYYSEDYPVMNRILKIMMQNSLQTPSPMLLTMSDAELANDYLGSHSLKEALYDSSLKPLVLNEVIKAKANTLKYYLIASIGVDSYYQLMEKIRRETNLKAYDFKKFIQIVEQQYHPDFQSYLTEWYKANSSADLYAQAAKTDRIVIDDVEKFRVEFMINNPSSHTAVISTKISSGDDRQSRRRRMRRNTDEDEKTQLAKMKFYILPPQSSYKIAELSEESPSLLEINTYISNNIPNSFRFTFDKITTQTRDTSLGMVPVSATLFDTEPGTIIIDNESEGFRIVNKNNRHKLRSFLQQFQTIEDRGRYQNLISWRPPSEWTLIKDANFYGTNIHSAIYRKKGKGNSHVEWKTTIPESGYYELYIWNAYPRHGGRNRGWDNNEKELQYYSIQYGTENEELELACNQEEGGWIPMGRFRFEQDEKVVVTLSDITDRNYVIADAIKFVKIEIE